MNNSSSKNGIIVLVVAIVFIGGIYFYMNGNPSGDSINSLSASSLDADAAKEGAEILTLLSQIKSLRIDTSRFSDPVYKTLIDYTVEVPPQNIGKKNPFANFVGTTVVETKTTVNPRTGR